MVLWWKQRKVHAGDGLVHEHFGDALCTWCSLLNELERDVAVGVWLKKKRYDTLISLVCESTNVREGVHGDGITYPRPAISRPYVVFHSPPLNWHSHICLNGGSFQFRSDHLWRWGGTRRQGSVPVLESHQNQEVRSGVPTSVTVWPRAVFVDPSCPHASPLKVC